MIHRWLAENDRGASGESPPMLHTRHRPALFLGILLSVFVQSGCASAPWQQESSNEISNVALMGVDAMERPTHRQSFAMVAFTPDPLEDFNRFSLGVTQGLLDWLVVPVAKAWRFVAPTPLRRSLDNFAYNLGWPIRFTSLLLQGRPRDSAVETGHFLVNSTLGLAGLMDVAKEFGIPTHREDIGQAFGSWGVGPGFYLVIPLFGPSSGRDLVGRVFDTALNPSTYFPGTGLLFNLNALSERIDGYEALTASEDDLYLPVRAFWSIQRVIEIEDYRIPPDAYANSDPEPSLGVLLLRVKDESFPRQAREDRVVSPNTGKKVPYSLWLQESAAPIVYILPGIGAHRGSSGPVALAELAFDRGYSVAVVSSPFHREFLLTGLSNLYPGYSPSDAGDLYAVLSEIHTSLQAQQPGKISGAHLLGYSLGGIESLFIAAQQEERAAEGLRFDSVVAINPPVDLRHAARNFERYFDAPLRWPFLERDRRVLEVGLKSFMVGIEGLESGKPLPFDRTESEFLVGLAARNTIINTLSAIEDRTGQGLGIKSGRPKNRGPLLEVVNRSSLARYGEELALPYLLRQRPEATREILADEANLVAVRHALENDDRIRVLTNANDFLLDEGDLEWLRETLGSRLTVFPDGGHLGNLYRPEVQQAVLEALDSLRNADSRTAAAGATRPH